MKKHLILIFGIFLLFGCDDDSITPRNISSLFINDQEVESYEIEPIWIVHDEHGFQVYIDYQLNKDETINFRLTQPKLLGEHALTNPFNRISYEIGLSQYSTFECDMIEGSAIVTRFSVSTSNNSGIYSVSFSAIACTADGSDEVTISGELIDYGFDL